MLIDGSARNAALMVVAALEEYNRGVDPKLRVSVDPASLLYGPGGGLDSLGLLELVTLLEAEIGQELGRPVAMVEESLATDGAAFRTVGSLIATVRGLLEPSCPGTTALNGRP